MSITVDLPRSASLDRRLFAFRADLADEALKAMVVADRYIKPDMGQVVSAPATALRPSPDRTIAFDTELLFGERVRVFEVNANGWAWVQAVRDNYVGYCEAEHIDLRSASDGTCTHIVSVPRTQRYASPELKQPPLDILTMQAELIVQGTDGKYAALADGTYVYQDHIAAITEVSDDPATVALSFLETPYVWGGKSALGFDCSALVQLCLQRCGIACPRDTDMIASMAWPSLPAESTADMLRRNDLVFWPGHVGVMLDNTRILHTNATDMSTRIWDLDRLKTHIMNIENNAVSTVLRPI